MPDWMWNTSRLTKCSSMNEGPAAQQLDIGVNGLATIYTVCGGVCGSDR